MHSSGSEASILNMFPLFEYPVVCRFSALLCEYNLFFRLSCISPSYFLIPLHDGSLNYFDLTISIHICTSWIRSMRLQRQQYGIYSLCSILFMIPCNYKLLFSFPKSHIKTVFQEVNLGLPYLKYFQVVFTLWVTLYLYTIVCFHYTIHICIFFFFCNAIHLMFLAIFDIPIILEF